MHSVADGHAATSSSPGHGKQSTKVGAIPIVDDCGEARSDIPNGLLGQRFHPKIPKLVGPQGGVSSCPRIC
ncbi:hypothetical protein NL676_012533 [Syzygium grande]|nr:hypothetical protein NL676_012533 [Syzygium grande]